MSTERKDKEQVSSISKRLRGYVTEAAIRGARVDLARIVYISGKPFVYVGAKEYPREEVESALSDLLIKASGASFGLVGLSKEMGKRSQDPQFGGGFVTESWELETRQGTLSFGIERKSALNEEKGKMDESRRVYFVRGLKRNLGNKMVDSLYSAVNKATDSLPFEWTEILRK